MVYVYCRRGSDSARALANGLGGQRLRKFDGMDFWRKGKRIKFKPNDILICWGDAVGDIEGVRVLNGTDVPNKFEAAQTLLNAGVNTIRVFKKPPFSSFAANEEKNAYIGRKFDHIGGNDLLNPTPNPDYWVTKLKLKKEFRIHSFSNKSIRAGQKRLREGYSLDPAEVAASNGQLKLASDWIRSYDGGWRIVYNEFQSRQNMRTLAHKAVEALGLTFGAVDVGQLTDGSYIVLEVNRAPGIEGNSIDAYINAVKGWINEAEGIQGGASEKRAEVQPEGAAPAAPADPGVPGGEGAVPPKKSTRWVGPINVPNPAPVNRPVEEGAINFRDIRLFEAERIFHQDRRVFAQQPPAPNMEAPPRRPGQPRYVDPFVVHYDQAQVGRGVGGGLQRAGNAEPQPRMRVSWQTWQRQFDRLPQGNFRNDAYQDAREQRRLGQLPFSLT